MASDDLSVMSAIVAGMSADDLEEGMELAGISGQLVAASDVLEELDMPILSAFLYDRGEWLREIAVNNMLRFGATRALSEAMAETQEQIEELGTDEVNEGLTRMALSEDAAIASEELAAAGARLAAEGLAEIAAARAMGEASAELAVEGIAQVAEGAADLGESEALHATADAVEAIADETDDESDN
jgi:hypothetical protein